MVGIGMGGVGERRKRMDMGVFGLERPARISSARRSSVRCIAHLQYNAMSAEWNGCTDAIFIAI